MWKISITPDISRLEAAVYVHKKKEGGGGFLFSGIVLELQTDDAIARVW